jgi:thioester reductase-like protein
MERYGVWREGDAARIAGVVGDLARPYLGLDRAAYERLAATAELIVHNGALSSYALSYRRLKPVNVLGTVEVLRLACRGRVKPVHYVSSLAVYPGLPGAPRWTEADVTEPEGVVGGYRQTKWVGDVMMAQARRRGVPTTVYRPGLISGAQATGACSTDTFINASIKGCVQLGATFPFDAPLEATPVDFCAAVIAHVALGGRPAGPVLNLPGARTMAPPELFDHVEAYGYPMRRLPYVEWLRELTAAVERGEENELARFLPLFGEDGPSEEVGYQGGRPVYDTANLRSALAGSGIECAEPDRALWQRYLRWFVAAGYLPEPPR